MPKYIEAVSAATIIAEKHGTPIAELVDTFAEIPDADVAQVRHGRWEEWWPGIDLIMTGEEMLYRCSVCDAKYSTVESKYCPNCGAKMDGGKQ